MELTDGKGFDVLEKLDQINFEVIITTMHDSYMPLGGGVAMQFAYQFPQLVDRLILVGAGGVTRDVNVALRIASLPMGSEALALLRLPMVIPALQIVGRLAGRVQPPIGRGLASFAQETYRRVWDYAARRDAFVAWTARVPRQGGARIAVPLFGNLGSQHHVVSTGSDEAQRYFDQGLSLVFGFNHDEAVRAFFLKLFTDGIPTDFVLFKCFLK